MIEKKNYSESPISLDDFQKIESTQLSSLERHHLRLMAHCLGCFQGMAEGRSKGPLPKDENQLEWFLHQPGMANEKEFISDLLEQFALAGKHLECLAATLGISPLELTVDDLIHASLKSNE